MGASKSRKVFPPPSVQHLLILLLVSKTKILVLLQAVYENKHVVPVNAGVLPNASSTTKSSDLLISSIPEYWKGKKHLKLISSGAPVT